MPLTGNGKLDRAALAAHAAQATSRVHGIYTAPQTELERVVAGVWEEVLGVEAVGGDDNFFDLGGQSLLLVRVHSRLVEKLGREIAVVELFRYPTVRTLARHLSGEGERAARPAVERDGADADQAGAETEINEGKERLRKRLKKSGSMSERVGGKF
jgi:hypothetical protein